MFIYALAREFRKPISKIDSDGNVIECFKEVTESSGLYIYDIYRLIKSGKLEFYKLSSASVGNNRVLSYSIVNQRVAFGKDFSSILILPFAHRNTIEFLGMQPREEYLIWREKNGFFTALDKHGLLRTWSVASG